MDKKNNSNNINRNRSSFYNYMKNRIVRNNLVTPEIFVSEIWLQEDAKNGVEIIELNSSNSEIEEKQQPTTFSQAWSFLNHDRFKNSEEDHRINKIAREKWRKKNEEKFSAYANEYLQDHDSQTNFNELMDDSEISGISHNESMNCFTIINNHVVNSGSSSESEYARVEEIEPYYTENINDSRYWDHVYKDDTIGYDPSNAEQRTVWIYSFKNKPRLSENDFELVDIPSINSTETSTSPLSDEEYKTNKSTNICRIASPIPGSFIPRLDLSLAQTLSTVTELSEIKNSEESLSIKPINNWLTERYIENSKNDGSSVVNWMALSPRERRRRFKNTLCDSEHGNKDRKDFFTYAEGNAKCKQTEPEKPEKPSSSVIKVDVEVHANAAPDITPTIDIDVHSIESFSSKSKVKEKETVKTRSIDINTEIAEIAEIADTEIDDENEGYNIDQLKKPSIQLTLEKSKIITEPLEKLKNCQWIIPAENIEERTAGFDYVLNNNECVDESLRSLDVGDSASKRLWMKHVRLMKSPLWTEYLPITETPPSLHLSLSLSSIGNKQSWFKRIGNYFKCCK